MSRLIAIVASTLALAAGQASAQAVPANITAALADKTRPAADTARDAVRKPGELLAFAGVKPGDNVADFIIGGGYFTRILASAVGPTGKVFAYQPAEFIAYSKDYGVSLETVGKALSNVTTDKAGLGALDLPDGLDLVFTGQNYHDMHMKVFPAGTAAKTNAEIFKSLKPGGVFLVVDHEAKAGSGITAADTPHRIDIATYSVRDGAPRRVAVTSTVLAGEATSIDLPAGDLQLLNDGDLTFAAIRPDAESLRLMLAHLGALPEPLSRALVVGTITQLLLLGELAPRDAATALNTALHTERNPALVEPFLSVAPLVADRWAPPAESPALRSALADAALVLASDPVHRQPALRTLAASATTPDHWAALEEAAAAATDADLAWRMAVRRSELGQRDDDTVDRLLARDPDPDAGVKRLKVLGAGPDEETKEAVWRAFFVDYSVPASRDTLELGSIFWRPGQRELLAPYAHRYLEELPTLKGGMLNQGVVVRAMYPHAVGDAAFLSAADAATSDESISQYARNQVHAQSFVLAQLNRSREL